MLIPVPLFVVAVVVCGSLFWLGLLAAVVVGPQFFADTVRKIHAVFTDPPVERTRESLGVVVQFGSRGHR